MGGVDAAAEHDQHVRMCGVFTTAQEHSPCTQMDKALELKENRLHSLYTRVNTAHTTGAELRLKINNLRREKLAFEGAHRFF